MVCAFWDKFLGLHEGSTVSYIISNRCHLWVTALTHAICLNHHWPIASQWRSAECCQLDVASVHRNLAQTVDRLASVALPRFVIHRIKVWDVRKKWIGSNISRQSRSTVMHAQCAGTMYCLNLKLVPCFPLYNKYEIMHWWEIYQSYEQKNYQKREKFDKAVED